MVSKKTFGLIMILITPVLFLGFLSAWVKHQELSRRYQNLVSENQAIEENNRKLEELLKYLSLETVKELEIRKKLNYTKPGEKLVIFLSPSPTPETTPAVKKQSWWEKLFSLFKR